MKPSDFDDDLDDFHRKPAKPTKKREHKPRHKSDSERERDQSHRYKPEPLRQMKLKRCSDCGGIPDGCVDDNLKQLQRVYACGSCDGIGWLDVPVDDAAMRDRDHRPGTEARIAIFAKRYALGLDLWSGCDELIRTPATVFRVPDCSRDLVPHLCLEM